MFTEMLRISYRINEKTTRLSRRQEEFRRLKFEVSRLRSPQHLEQRLGELSVPLTLPKQIQVMRVPARAAAPRLEALPVEPPSHRILNFLGRWVQIAQARTEQ